jgi:hypothetical protein
MSFVDMPPRPEMNTKYHEVPTKPEVPKKPECVRGPRARVSRIHPSTLKSFVSFRFRFGRALAVFDFITIL